MTNDENSLASGHGQPSFGFRLLARKQQLKLDLDAGGLPALVSLISAIIASGTNFKEAIVDQVAEITGPYCDETVELVLRSRDEIDWYREGDGTYTLFRAY